MASQYDEKEEFSVWGDYHWIMIFSDITITTVFLLTSSSVCLRFLTLLAGVDPAGKVQNFCWLNNKASSLFHLEIREIKRNLSLFQRNKERNLSLFIIIDRESGKVWVASMSWGTKKGTKAQRKPNPRKSFWLRFHSKFFHYDLCANKQGLLIKKPTCLYPNMHEYLWIFFLIAAFSFMNVYQPPLILRQRLQPAFVNMLIRKPVPAEFLRWATNIAAHPPHPHSRHPNSMAYSMEITQRRETR